MAISLQFSLYYIFPVQPSAHRWKRLFVCIFSLSFGLLMLMFPSVLWHCWLGDRKGIRPVKKLDVAFLVVIIWLELCTTYSSCSSVVTTTSIILCFNKHRLTQVHLENGHENGERWWDIAYLRWLKWFCEAGGGGSPDEARLEQTPYPFQTH